MFAVDFGDVVSELDRRGHFVRKREVRHSEPVAGRPECHTCLEYWSNYLLLANSARCGGSSGRRGQRLSTWAKKYGYSQARFAAHLPSAYLAGNHRRRRYRRKCRE